MPHLCLRVTSSRYRAGLTLATLNLGILAHIDAGKTTLTERLLFTAGVIDQIGSVDSGSTQTDSLELERRRGITIKSAVVSFDIQGVTINLIDTPGHPDFIAEVERVLDVLNGVVLVISAVEGVQAQTLVLMRALQRLHVPTLIFVNKIDRPGADLDRIVAQVAGRLTPAVVQMGMAKHQGTPEAQYIPYASDDPAFTAQLLEQLSDNDDALTADYVSGKAIAAQRLVECLRDQTAHARIHPVFAGSAITAAGLNPLISGITGLLPVKSPATDGPTAGAIFKVDRGPDGEKIAYLHVTSGTVHTRDRMHFDDDREGKVTAIRVFEQGQLIRRDAITAGHIAQVSGLKNVHIGDTVGQANRAEQHFPPPSLETVVIPIRPEQGVAVHTALSQLAEQDPLINLRHDEDRHETHVSLYGEVQKEVIQATLAEEYGLHVTFEQTTPICIERAVETGSSTEFLGKGGNPYVATAGFRIDPGADGSGIQFHSDVTVDGIPIHVYKHAGAFHDAIERTVRATLQQGLHGWQVTDCVVTMTHAGYTPATIAKDFRLLTPLVLMDALNRAGTIVCEPIHRFVLDIPTDTVGQILTALGGLGAIPDSPATQGPTTIVQGQIPATAVDALQRRLSSLTRGEGILESVLDHHRPVNGPAPTRRRTGINPLDRNDYLRRNPRGV